MARAKSYSPGILSGVYAVVLDYVRCRAWREDIFVHYLYVFFRIKPVVPVGSSHASSGRF